MLLAAYSTESEVRSTLVKLLFDGDLVQPFLQNCDEALLSFNSASEAADANHSFQGMPPHIDKRTLRTNKLSSRLHERSCEEVGERRRRP
jgi:hypothetical protein